MPNTAASVGKAAKNALMARKAVATVAAMLVPDPTTRTSRRFH